MTYDPHDVFQTGNTVADDYDAEQDRAAEVSPPFGDDVFAAQLAVVARAKEVSALYRTRMHGGPDWWATLERLADAVWQLRALEGKK